MAPERTNEQWISDLSDEGATRDAAIQYLITWLERRLFFYLRERSDLARVDADELHQMAADFAQDSVLIIIEKYEQFAGRSKFTTWAAKIAVHQALGEMRRARWRDLSLDELTQNGSFEPRFLASDQRSPETETIQKQAVAIVMDVMQKELSERQRLALYSRLVLGVPIAILAEQMQTNTNALYKLIHDGRKRLKERLREKGISPEEVLSIFR